MGFASSPRPKLVYIKELNALVQEDLVGDVLRGILESEVDQSETLVDEGTKSEEVCKNEH